MKSETRGSKKKKDTLVSGEVQLQFSIVDPANPSATPQDILQRFMSLADSSPAEDAEEDEELTRLESLGTPDDEDDDEKEAETSDETDDPNKPEVAAKRRKRLRLKRLRRKTKARAYEFTDGADVVGIAFLEISKITDLPPERNSKPHFRTQCLSRLTWLASDSDFIRYGPFCGGLPWSKDLSHQGHPPQFESGL